MEGMDAKLEQNAESVSKKEEGSQKEMVEETVFRPVQISGNSGEVLVKKGEDKQEIEVDQRLQELLKCISEETLQLRGFLTEENRLMNELCLSIKQIMKKLRVSFSIPPQNIQVKKKAKRVILKGDGHLMLVYEKGEVHSAFLAEYPPGVVMTVLWVVIPKLAEVVAEYRKKVSKRIGFFRKLKKELKSIAKAVGGGKGETQKSAEETKDVAKK